MLLHRQAHHEPRTGWTGHLEAAAVRAGFRPDYAAIRRAEDLAEPAEGEREGLVALIAARLGSTRLIDNLLFD